MTITVRGWQKWDPVLGSRAKAGSNMQRLRLKADGRIVELRDGQEFPLVPATALAAPEPARALLTVIAHAPETVFAALARV